MSAQASPIDIASPNKRYSSNSPGNHTSNLTFALQQAASGRNASPPPSNSTRQSAMDIKTTAGTRNDSLSVPYGSSHTAARPISVNQRRESAFGGGGGGSNSFMGGGMSWGGMSMGSFIHDDVMMGGVSPGLNSPSLHSSSYLPRMEANFWNNLKCCETTFNNLHELVAHFEDVHNKGPTTFPYAMSGPGSERLPRRKSSSTNPGDWRAANQVRGFQPSLTSNATRQQLDSLRKPSTINMQDMGTIGEMELDDSTSTQGQDYGFPNLQDLNFSSEHTPQMSNPAVARAQGHDGQDSGFQSSSSQTPPGIAQQQQMRANFNGGSMFTGLDPSGFVVGTGMQQQQSTQPSGQAQHQPFHESTANYAQGDGGAMGNGLFNSTYNNSNNVPFNNDVMSRINTSMRSINMDFGSTSDMVDLCVDEPAKNLYSADGGFNSQQYPHFNFTSKVNGDGSGNNGDENAKKLQAQRLAAGIGKQESEEERPFKCPVIGCEKAYKNANGLRYHEKHGHQTQKLAENGDGTFSIVDPVTSIPYPGTVGMEKEKPYRCDVCGKRYKNLNGLKYHRNHSPPCNPDFNVDNLHLEMDGEAVY